MRRFSSTVRLGKIRRPSGTSAMPSRTRRCGGNAGERPPVEADRRPSRPAQAGDRLEQRRLAGAVGADDGDASRPPRPRRDAEQRLEVAVAGIERARPRAAASCASSSRRGRRCAPRSEAITSCGSPSISLPAVGDRQHPVDDASSACTMCSIQTIATPVVRRSRTVSTSSCTSGSVSPPAISSSSSSRGPVASARASSSRLRSSSVSVPASALALREQAVVRAPRRRRVARPSTAASERCADQHVLEHRHVPRTARDLGRARRARAGTAACAGQRVTSRPSKCTVPASGRRSPAMRFSSVVLPAPFGPTMPSASPGRDEARSSMTARPPKRLSGRRRRERHHLRDASVIGSIEPRRSGRPGARCCRR